MSLDFYSADAQWRRRLAGLLNGSDVIMSAPRGMRVREQLHQTVAVDLAKALLVEPRRKLNHRFAAAEALWILDGRSDVGFLAQYNKRMRDFSDDGFTLAGAYGPRLAEQLEWVIDRLLADRDTRQAVASIWTPRPAPSKDIPCTLSLTFMIRGGALHCHAFMRSSDVWLGLPYDLFSFACYATGVACRYNDRNDDKVALGRLWLTAASSHLYAEHDDAAANIAASPTVPVSPYPWPVEAVEAGSVAGLRAWLKEMIEKGPLP